MKINYDLTREELGALIPVLKAGTLNEWLAECYIEACYTAPGKEFTLVCTMHDLTSPVFFSFNLGLEIGKNIQKQPKFIEPWNR